MSSLIPASDHTSRYGGQADELQELNSHMRDLENQLRIARKRRDALQAQVPSSQLASNRLPPEVLTMIFQHYPDEQQKRNAAFMRVCKQWHRIVMSTSWLWSNIILVLQHINDVPTAFKYARACLEHSKGDPLDIFVDAHDFAISMDLYEDIVDERGSTHRYQQSTWYQELEGKIDDALEDTTLYHYAFVAALAVLRGNTDEFISRWRILRVYIPCDFEESAALQIWESLDGRLENLVTLDIRWKWSLHGGSTAPSGYPVDSSLRSLTTDIHLNLNHLYEGLSHLEQLSLLNPSSTQAFWGGGFLNFISLRDLELVVRWHGNLNSQGLPFLPNTITLPNLRTLALLGPRHAEILEYFEVPQLTHLSLAFLHEPVFSKGIDEIDPLVNVTAFRWTDPPIEDLSVVLTTMTMKMPILQRIYLPQRQMHRYSEVVTILEKIRREGHTVAFAVDDPNSWPVQLNDSYVESPHFLTGHKLLSVLNR